VAWSSWPEEECLHDGGDRGERAGLDAEGQLRGLDAEDTVAEYTDSYHRRRLTCSNRVCVCVPRFAALRTELAPARANAVVGPGDRAAILRQQQLERRLLAEQARLAERLEAARSRLRPSVNVNSTAPVTLLALEVLQARELNFGPLELLGTQEVRRLTQVEIARLLRQMELAVELSSVSRLLGTEQVIGTAVIGRVEQGTEVFVGTLETRDFSVCCHEAPCTPDKPLLLIKCTDKLAAQVGDIITFTLRYSNHGGRPITDVAVTDSLSGRLEYVPGSAESDRNAVLTTQENEAGSVILRWEVTGQLMPGESGRLRFKARVR
jgi:uncharacterized repeat protein (TIGR01451 family)